MRAFRSVAALLLVLAAAHGQQPLPEGRQDPDALRKLAAMLNGGNGQLPPGIPDLGKLSEEDLKRLGEFAQAAANNPAMRDHIKNMVRQNPNLLQQVEQARPGLAKEMRRNVPNLPEPGSKPPENRPRPGPGGPRPDNPGANRLPPQNGPNPSGGPQPPPPNPLENREYLEAAKAWENAFGPLDSTPAVRQTMMEVFAGMARNNPGGKPFWADWNLNSKDSSLGNWLKGLNGGTLPSWMKNINLPKLFGDGGPKINPPNVKLPTAPKLPSFGFGGFGMPSISLAGLGTGGTVLLVVLAVALVAFLVWKFAPQLGLAKRDKPTPLPGLGPWPFDPRMIADRPTLVRAFEYVSVLLCGDGARVWNHATIAEALRETVPAAAPFAEPLARLYALARYTPLSDELSPAAVAEARGYLCRLAGVPES